MHIFTARALRSPAIQGILASLLLAGQALCASATDTLVEFYNTTLIHYFLTIDPTEAVAIDSGSAGPGWQRTGKTIAAYRSASGATVGAVVVCRFYGNQSNGGANGHFYTADAAECTSVKLDPGWMFERNEWFNADGLTWNSLAKISVHSMTCVRSLPWQLRSYLTICSFGLGFASGLPPLPSAGAPGGVFGASPGWPDLNARP